ncbi:hypothetical protein BAE44_0024517 [Dichanthelium oligosanthes]|uniref:Wound-induced protein 1 n=1 Tax=Dichanthelium oligosanthes TaxID=888268 RepID=A0A1E5UNJ8_9POAL|nr:hypothetical protein BAE44_0024517 [Dichanthelium oligosanthes]
MEPAGAEAEMRLPRRPHPRDAPSRLAAPTSHELSPRDFVTTRNGPGRAASPFPIEEVEEPASARGSRLELATHHGQGAAALPRPHEASELAAFAGEESEEQRNRFLVLRLYEALNARDARRAQELLAPDLEWWFHGPPARQHMMRLLTGAEKASGGGGFVFSPHSVDAFGSTVIAEGADDARQLYWVHAWTVGPDGVITQLREYFNTDLTVTLLSGAASAKNAAIAAAPPKQDAASSSSSSPPPSATSSSPGPKCLWQSRRADRAHKSLPGLVLAI